MKCQLLSILIYGKNNQVRSIELRPNAVNIITGQSKTGKSSLLHIVDYCLGSKTCNIPAGVIRKHVDWYGVKIKNAENEFFIARRNPSHEQQSSEDIYFELGKKVISPEDSDALGKNANLETLCSILSEAIGIDRYEPKLEVGQTRKTGKADIRKALFYCFQEQSEVDNQKFLFHRQGDQYIPQTIKDYLPYFLGVYTKEVVKNREDLRRYRKELKKTKSRVAEKLRIKGEGFTKAFSLLNEAQEFDLLPKDISREESWSRVKQFLQDAAEMDVALNMDEPDIDILNSLFEEQKEMRRKYREIQDELDAYKHLKDSSYGFRNEMQEQKARLEAINLWNDIEGIETCPLCSSPLETPVPSIATMRKVVQEINSQLEDVTNDTPHINMIIDKTAKELEEIRKKIKEITLSIKSLQETNEAVSHLRDFNLKQVMIQGRLSLYLESLPHDDNTIDENETKVEELESKIRDLAEQLDKQVVQERWVSVLSFISNEITELAKQLDVEHSKSPLRLDMTKLTIVADTEDGPIPMTKMGSGDTWVNLHIATHLALHNWFVKKDCPVPQFLFLDQPSQAYFPPDYSPEDITSENNADIQSVHQIFQLIEKQANGFQVIITEHANFKEHWYQNLVRENWWDGITKLIPVEWIEKSDIDLSN